MEDYARHQDVPSFEIVMVSVTFVYAVVFFSIGTPLLRFSSCELRRTVFDRLSLGVYMLFAHTPAHRFVIHALLQDLRVLYIVMLTRANFRSSLFLVLGGLMSLNANKMFFEAA